jgi:signal transduction histidine kinase
MRIRIVDTGIGIAAKDMDKVLAPFGQVRDKSVGCVEGTGLGLPLSKTLVEKHGGKLDLKSRPGHGTTITIRFPPVRLVA